MSASSHAKGGSVVRGLELLNLVDYRLIESDADREEIFRLRYRAYMNEGVIEPRGDHRLADRYDDEPNSWIFGVYFDGILTSSIRVSVSTPDMPRIPSAAVFPEYLEPEIARGKIIVDPNRFVADPVRAIRLPELAYLTVRLGYVACEFFHADIGLAAVRTEHQAFYRRVFMHKVVCPPRPYPTLTKPISLTAVDYPSVREKIFQRYPIFRSTQFERRMLYSRRPEAAKPTVVTLREPGKSQISIAPQDAVRTDRAVAISSAVS
ncbi:MAG: hypothetical protein P4M07_07300 [Xanthobacteraceae bacterium]|nr:hypothetical protein [Xanthobacteraceae bacterium]